MVSAKSKALLKRDYLTLLSKAKNPRQRNALIDLADTNHILAVSECILNLLKGKIPISNQTKNRLARHKKSLRTLMTKSTSVKRKKHILKQKGGLLPLLLGGALSAIPAIVEAAT